MNFNVSTLPSSQSKAITVDAGSLEIVGCTINNQTIVEGIDSIFEVGDALLSFKVNVKLHVI